MLWTAVATVLYLTHAFWGDWTSVFAIWLLSIPVTLFGSFFLGMVLAALGIKVEDEDADDEDPSAEPEIALTVTHAEIIRRSESIGTYNGQQIYDWIVIKNADGSETKLTFVKKLTNELDSDVAGEFFIMGELVYDKEDAR